MDEDSDTLFFADFDGNNEGHVPQHLNVESELEKFRQQWQNEIRSNSQGASLRNEESRESENNPLDYNSLPSVEDQAKYLFLQGVDAEKNKMLTDAITYYRRAVQLVPDIEFRIEELRQTQKDHCDKISSRKSDDGLIDAVEPGSCDGENELCSLLLQTKLENNNLCEANNPQKSTHISCLPTELIVYIFRWVVSSDIDIISIQNLSQVCRGFYLCARDEDIWKRICNRVWGKNWGSSDQNVCYREMFFKKPHILFNGCYISKTTYYRQGEKGLDNFYKPVHVVQYYRYARFMLDGRLQMLTTPSEPIDVVSKLRVFPNNEQGCLIGYYKLAGNKITAILRRHKAKDPVYHYKRQQRGRNNIDEPEETFHVEFTLSGTCSKPCTQLAWSSYSVHTKYRLTSTENVSDFDLSNRSFPPLFFSRVKSYTGYSDSILL